MIDEADTARKDQLADRLAQGKAWYLTLHGTRWKGQGREQTTPLSELEPSHRRNLLSWLDRHALAIVNLAYWGPCQLPAPDDWGFEMAQEQEAEEMLDHPERWLHSTPFVKELERLIREDEVRWRTAETRMRKIEPDVFDAVV